MNTLIATVYGNSVVHIAHPHPSNAKIAVATLCGSEGRRQPKPLVVTDREVNCPKCRPVV